MGGRRTIGAGLLVAAAALPGAASAKCTVGQMVELKVTMLGRRPTVPLTINGHQERFLVDSGAFHSNISPGTAVELGLPLTDLPDNFSVTGIGGQVRPKLAVVKQLGLAGINLKDVQFVVGGSEIGSGAAGLMGQNVLSVADVEYDFGHGAVRLMKLDGCKNAVPVYWSTTKPISVVELERGSRDLRHTIGTIWINGVKMQAVFDTGASRTTLTLAAAARLGLKPGDPRMQEDGFGSGIGRKLVASYRVPIASIKLGNNEEVRNTHLDAEPMDIDGDLLVGADFFLSHRVFVANSMDKLFFTYEGGPIFGNTAGQHIDTTGKTVATEADTTAAPTDAAGFGRLGAAALSRHDMTEALVDLDKAVAMAPQDATYRLLRARAYLASDQPHHALGEVDEALTLAPDNLEARTERATLRLRQHDRVGAAADANAVADAAPPASNLRLELAGLFAALGERQREIAQYDLWLKYHPDDFRVPTALNGRCWARAQLGIDLAKALSDCDASIRARPDADNIDSRGLVRLRMGDNAKAIRDYDAALAKNPGLAWSLYGRGLAKRRLGDTKGGDADITAALAEDREIGDRMKAIGVTE